jgi:hypothetical protein
MLTWTHPLVLLDPLTSPVALITGFKTGIPTYQSQSQSHITTDSQSVCLDVESKSGTFDQSFFSKLQSCLCGAPSLTRGRVRHLSVLVYTVYSSLPLIVASSRLYSSRDSVVGIATGYGFDDGKVGVRVPVGLRIFSSLICLHRFRAPTNCNECRRIFSRRSKTAGAWS